MKGSAPTFKATLSGRAIIDDMGKTLLVKIPLRDIAFCIPENKVSVVQTEGKRFVEVYYKPGNIYPMIQVSTGVSLGNRGITRYLAQWAKLEKADNFCRRAPTFLDPAPATSGARTERKPRKPRKPREPRKPRAPRLKIA